VRRTRLRINGIRKAVNPPRKGSTLGARLQWTRAYLGLSQEEFAEQIVTPNYYRRIKGRTIERWENGASKEMRRSVSLICT
jgi:transcriptional regulator with XRE-family HTH domain